MEINKSKVECICLILFMFIFFFYMSNFDSGLLIHKDGAVNFAAGDMFTFAAYTDLARYEKDITKQPPAMCHGEEDCVNFFSMHGANIGAQVSHFMNIESYDSVIHLNLLFIMLSIFIFYYMLRKLSVWIALLSLPITLLLFKFPFSYTLNWGMSLSNYNLLFVMVSLLCVYYIKEKYIWIVLGIVNGAGVLSHAREMLMFNLSICIYFLIRTIKDKKIDWVFIKYYLYSIPITMLFMFRHLPVLSVFKGSASTTNYGVNAWLAWMPPNKFHHVFFHQFGFYQWIILLSVILIIFLIIKKNDKLFDLISSFSLLFLFSGFFSILGNKTTQIRHLFPILLMPLIGILIYYCYDLFKDRIKKEHFHVLLFVAILILTIFVHQPTKQSEYSFSDPYTWEGMKWIRSNVGNTDKVLVLYGDRHTQITMFLLMRKTHFFVPQKFFVEDVQSGILKTNVTTEWGHVHFFMKQYKWNELEVIPMPISIKHVKESICSYNYLYVDKVSKNQYITNYIQVLINKLNVENQFVPVFTNELVLVLKNNNVSNRC